MVFAARDGAATTVPTRTGIGELQLTGLDPDAARGPPRRSAWATRRPTEVDRAAHRRDAAATRWPCWSCPTELSAGPARRVRAAAGAAAPHRPRRAGLPRPQPAAAAAGAVGAAARGRRRHRRARRRCAAQRPTSAWTSRPSRPPWPPGCSSPTTTSVAVRHPLVRSAIYQAATGEQRRRAHRALAEALAGLGDPDREAWHRAAAADGPDPEVVAALELVGSRAQRRGGYVAALAAYERAAALTHRRAAACRADVRGGPQRLGVRAGRPRPRPCSSAARKRADRPAAALRHRAPARAHRGQHRLGHRGAPDLRRGRARGPRVRPGPGPGDRRRRGRHAHLRRRQRHRRCRPATSSLRPAAATRPGRVCLKQMLVAMTQAAEGDWSGGRRGAGPGAGAPASEVDDRDVLWNLGNAALQLGDDDGPAALLLATPCRGPGRPGPSRRWSTACSGSASATSSPATSSRCAAAPRRPSPSRQSIGQPAMTALPIAWLTLLAALQDRDDYDDLLRRPRGGRRGAPAGHPDRPRARPDPLGQGDPRRWRPATPSAPCTTSAGSGSRCWRGWPPPSASRQPSAPARPDLARGWVDELAGVRRGHRPAVGPRHGRLRTGDDGRPERGRGAVRGGAVPPRARRSPARRGSHPAGLRRVAAPQPAPRRRPPAPAPAPSRPSRTCAPRRWPRARTRSCAPPARPPASATPPPW